MSPQERPVETNFLADYAGIEFECSIAAAELNKSVHATISRGENRKNITLIGVEHELVREAVVKDTNWYFNYHDEHIPVVLAQPVLPQQEVASNVDVPKKSRLRWLSSRDVETPSAQQEQLPMYGDPIMALSFDGDLLPFASFAMRLDSDTCSYVQLGSEVNGETLFATRLDEATTRNDIVEAMRRFRTGGDPRIVSDEVALLIGTELERQNENLRELLEKQLSKAMLRRFGKTRVQESMQRSQFIDTPEEGAAILGSEVYFEPLTPRYDLHEDHLQGWLALMKQTDGSHIDLGVVTRGTVFRSLLRADGDGELTSPYDVKELPLHTLRRLTRITRFRPITDEYQQKVKNPDNFTDVSLQNNPWLYADTIGLVDTYTKYTNREQKQAIRAALPKVTSNGFVRLLGLQLNEGEGGVLRVDRYDRGVFDAFILEVAEERKATYQQLFAELHVAEAVSDITASTHAGENLLNLLGLYCPGVSAEYKGQINNMQIGKTIGSLDFEAAITRDSSNVRLQLAARPSSMPQEGFRDLYDVELDFLQRTELDDKRITDLLRVLGALRQTKN